MNNTRKPHTVPEHIIEFLANIHSKIFDYFGVTELTDAVLFKSMIVFFLIFIVIILLRPIHRFSKKYIIKLAKFMSKRIILREIVYIYTLIDNLVKRSLYALFLAILITLMYSISYFIQLWILVNSLYHIFGYEDLVMIFIYRL